MDAEARRLTEASGQPWVDAAVWRIVGPAAPGALVGERSIVACAARRDRVSAAALLDLSPEPMRHPLADYRRLAGAMEGIGSATELDSLSARAGSAVVREEIRPWAIRAWLARGDSARALPLLRAQVRSASGDVRPWAELWARTALGSAAPATEALRMLCGRHPGPASLELLRLDAARRALEPVQRGRFEVEALAATGSLRDAIARAERLLAAEAKGDLRLRMRRAELLLARGRAVEGRAAWRELDGLAEVEEKAVLAIARSYKSEGDTASALDVYEELAQRFPRWRSRALWAAAWLREQSGARAAAIETLDRLLAGGAGGSLRSQAWLHRILLKLEANDRQAALADAERLAGSAGASAQTRQAAAYWAWVARGRPQPPPPLALAHAAVFSAPQGRALNRALMARVEARRDSLLAVVLAGDAPPRPRLRVALERTRALGRLGLDLWARAEIAAIERLHPRDGPEALGAARAALGVLAVDVYLRIVRPRLERDGFEPGDPSWDLLLHPLLYAPLAEAALDGTVDPLLACAMIEVESAGNPSAHSPAGALGLMQLLPSTARNLAGATGGEALDLQAPAVNIRLGCAYLTRLMRRFGGREERAIAAYNAGPAAVARWEARAPRRDAVEFAQWAEFAETRTYLRRVLSVRATMADVLDRLGG